MKKYFLIIYFFVGIISSTIFGMQRNSSRRPLLNKAIMETAYVMAGVTVGATIGGALGKCHNSLVMLNAHPELATAKPIACAVAAAPYCCCCCCILMAFICRKKIQKFIGFDKKQQ